MMARGLKYIWLGTMLLGGGAAAGAPAAAPLRVVTTFYPLYIATRNLTDGVPGVSTLNMTRPVAGCLHDYQLTTADLVTLQQADILVVNGAGLESFLDKALRQAPRARVIQASAGIPLLNGNPHVWVSPALAIRQVANIAAGLAQYDPAHAGLYRAHAARYTQQLEALQATLHRALQNLADRDIITFHEAFPYFAQEFGLRVAGVVEREPGSEPDARSLAATIATVRRLHVPVIFVEPQYPARAAQVIARETGARIATLDPCVSGPPAPDAYLRCMERNLAELQRALAPAPVKEQRGKAGQ